MSSTTSPTERPARTTARARSRWRHPGERRPTGGASCGRSRSRSAAAGRSRRSVPARGLPADTVPPRRHRPARPTSSPPASRRATAASSTRASSTRCDGCWPGPGDCRGPRAKRSATRSCRPSRRATPRSTRRSIEAVRRTRQFARRQRAWFRRDPRIEWLHARADPFEVLPVARANRVGRGAVTGTLESTCA